MIMLRQASYIVWIVSISSVFLGLCICINKSDAFDLTLVYSGDEQGILWAHGCGEDQVGGLDRRHTVMKSLQMEHSNLLNIHVGNIVDPNTSDREMIYQVALEAFDMMNYHTVCIGVQDLCLPVDSMKALQANHPKLPFVCANVQSQGHDDLPFSPYAIQEYGSDSGEQAGVAVVGLLSQSCEAEVKAYNPEMSIIPPDDVLRKLADELENRSDIVITSFHASVDEAHELAERFPWIDVMVVVRNHAIENPEASQTLVSSPVMVGSTVIVDCPGKGEALGVLKMELDDGMNLVSSQNRHIRLCQSVKPSEDISELLSLCKDMLKGSDFVSSADVSLEKGIYVSYFYKRGCEKCDRAGKLLRELKGEYPSLVVESRNAKDYQTLLEAMGELYGIPDHKRLTTPVLFVGDDYFLDSQIDREHLEGVIQGYLPTGVAPRLAEARSHEVSAKENILARFRSLGILPVAGAGLLDGVNPCAFATLIFFISCLAMVRRERKDMLLAGVAFSSAVFVTYLLIGIGALRFLDFIRTIPFLNQIVYITAALLTLILAVVSFYDAYLARKGKLKDIKLQLPESIKFRIKGVIRTRTRTSGIVAGALVIGFVVSSLELVCTGQVYLPTLTFVSGFAGMKLHALGYLVLYNVMFILPLLVVFACAYWGVTALQLAGVLGQHAMGVKLGIGSVLLGLSAWLSLIVLL